MVAVRSHLSSLPLATAVQAGHSDAAMDAAARTLANGAAPRAVLGDLLAVGLEVCGLEAAGASWSHALLSVGATAGLLDEWGPELVRPAVVGAAGFLAHARPTRARSVPSGAQPWPGTPQWLDLIRQGDLDGAVRGWRGGGTEVAWRRASLMSAAGWGHQAIVGGHFARMAAQFPERSAQLLEAGIRAWVPLEVADEPMEADDTVLDAVTAALELLGRSANLRAVHGVTYAREVYAASLTGALEPEEVARLAGFVRGGWERARRDRRLRGEAAVYDPSRSMVAPPEMGWDELVGELCRTELRPGFGHNVKIAETCSWLRRSLPQSLRPRVHAALAATLPAWTRSRRPALILRSISRPTAQV